MTPIFIFSLPRSGSTLLQRLLATHEKVATASEPWLLLPLMYALREEGSYAEYGHRLAVEAVGDFCTQLPGGRSDYLASVRKMALDLYGRASAGEASYFVDKTPRYHLIVDEIMEAFPEGRFIFLWRNPLAVAASIMDTIGCGKWNLFHFYIDLFAGLENLVDAFGRHRDRVFSIRYEDIVEGDKQGIDSLFDYLGLSVDKAELETFGDVKLAGKMGDASGWQAYDQLSTEPLSKWLQTMHNPVRQAWCRRYLHWIGAERLALMGYEMDDLIKELDKAASGARHVGSDLLRMAYGGLYRKFEPHILRKQLSLAVKGQRIHVHT